MEKKAERMGGDGRDQRVKQFNYKLSDGESGLYQYFKVKYYGINYPDVVKVFMKQPLMKSGSITVVTPNGVFGGTWDECNRSSRTMINGLLQCIDGVSIIQKGGSWSVSDDWAVTGRNPFRRSSECLPIVKYRRTVSFRETKYYSYRNTKEDIKLRDDLIEMLFEFYRLDQSDFTPEDLEIIDGY